MMEALQRYVRAAFFWMWVCIGLLLAYSSYSSFGAGFGALFFGIAFLYFGLKRLKNAKPNTKNVGHKRVAVSVFSVVICVVGMHGFQAFVRDHEASFSPLIAALERHRDVTGEYPDEIGELVPEFVASLPECPVTADRTGDRYYFKRKQGHRLAGTYIIQCPVGALFFPALGIYESDAREWLYD